MPHSSKYLTNEAVFSLPGGFRDSTSNVLSWSGDDGRSITLTVQRADSEGLSIHAFAERAVREYSSGLRDFALDSSAERADAMIRDVIASFELKPA